MKLIKWVFVYNTFGVKIDKMEMDCTVSNHLKWKWTALFVIFRIGHFWPLFPNGPLILILSFQFPYCNLEANYALNFLFFSAIAKLIRTCSPCSKLRVETRLLNSVASNSTCNVVSTKGNATCGIGFSNRPSKFRTTWILINFFEGFFFLNCWKQLCQFEEILLKTNSEFQFLESAFSN